MHEFPNAFKRNCNYLVEALGFVQCAKWKGKAVLEAVGHNFAIMDSDPDGGIVEQLGTISEKYRIRN